MTGVPIVLPRGLITRFSQDIVPILAARGVRDIQDPEALLCELLHTPDAEMWCSEVTQPVPGGYYAIGIEDRKDARLFDCRPSWEEGVTPTDVGEVTNVVGTRAYVSPVKKGSPLSKKSQASMILFYRIKELTLTVTPSAGTRLLIADRIMANERVPIAYLLQCPVHPARSGDFPVSFHPLRWLPFEPPESWYASTCSKCRGSAHCTVCDGTGILVCKRCSGGGRLTCHKCGGSGNFRPHDHDCRSCSGKGSVSCRPCGGRGLNPCRPCHGTGKCNLCKGSGLQPINYDLRNNAFVLKENGEHGVRHVEIDPSNVTVFDWLRRCDVSSPVAVETFLNDVLKASSARGFLLDNVACKMAAQHWKGLLECLDHFIQPDEQSPALLLGDRAAVVGETPGYIDYDFKVLPTPEWKSSGEMPWPEGTLLQLFTGQQMQAGEPLAISSLQQGPGGRRNINEVELKSGRFENRKTLYLRLRFPNTVDKESIPEVFRAQPRRLSGAEIKQKAYVRQWCDAINWEHPVFRAMVSPPARPRILPSLEFKDPHIAGNPQQAEAVQLALSDEVPVALVKGPPGTGKTSVIVEVVRHIVERGGRVLVCSQTHQAVVNVMERLEEDKCRMLRYARAERREDIDQRCSFDIDRELSLLGERADKKFQSLRVRCKELKHSVDTWYCVTLALREYRARIAQIQRKGDESTRIRHEQLASARAKAGNDQLALNTAHSQRMNALQTSRDECQKRVSAQEAILAANTRRQTQLRTRIDNRRFLTEIPTLVSQFAGIFSERLSSKTALETKLKSYMDKADQAKAALLSGKHEAMVAAEAVAHETAAHQKSTEQIYLHLSQRERVIEEEFSRDLQRFGKERSALDEEYFNPLMPLRDLLSEEGRSLESWTEDDQNALVEKYAAELARTQSIYEVIREWRDKVIANRESGEISKFLMDDVQVFLATCVGLASWKELHNGRPQSIDLVIIDEAGKATTPETLIPAFHARRLLLIGDDMQLPPNGSMNVDCVADAERHPACPAANDDDPLCLLDSSLFAELWPSFAGGCGVMLDRQFRMHRTIGAFISEVFYEGNLRSPLEAPHGTINFGKFTKPVCLISTMEYGEDRHEERVGTGYRNDLEANIVCSILEKAETFEHTREVSIGVITPYAAQKAAIERQLQRNAKYPFKRIRPIVDSVDSFQGSECDIIIVSFTRSPKPCRGCHGQGMTARGQRCGQCRGRGFLGTYLDFALDLKRMNVAFSRARCMLILVGDVSALCDERLSRHEKGREVLRRYRNYVLDTGKVCPVWEKNYGE